MAKRFNWLPLLLAAQFASASIASAADPAQDALKATEKGDYPQAQEAFQKVAQSGDPKVEAAIGMAYFEGIGVPLDHPKAMPFLLKAATQGRPDAQYRLGEAYDHTWEDPNISTTWNDPPQDHALAARWYDKARQSATALLPSGDPAAEITMARLMIRNLAGLFSDDDDTIQSLALAAARQGNVDAELFYGSRYIFSKDANKHALGTKWVTKAAIGGDSNAMVEIGSVLLDNGDPDHALPWLKEGALLNNPDAACMLKHHYNIPITCAADPTPEESAQEQEDANSAFPNPNQTDSAQPGATLMAQGDAAAQKSFHNEMVLFGILAVAMAAKIAAQPPRTQAQTDSLNAYEEQQEEKFENDQRQMSCQNFVDDGLLMWCP